MKKYIIDTDLGDDIDDALCIAYALKSGTNIIGVTTVFQNTVLRARLAKKILRLAGREDIPVFAGYGNPLASKLDTDILFCQYTPDLENDIYSPDGKDSVNAIDFIINSAKQYGMELTILAIGAQTNIAKAYLKNPQIMKNINIICMGGVFFEQYREWNIFCDPEAAEIICNSEMNIEYISHDVTCKCLLTDEESKSITGFTEGLEGYLSTLVKIWMQNAKRLPILHDPLAMGYALGCYVGMEALEIAIETKGKYTRGMSLNVPEMVKYYIPQPFKGKIHKVSKEVDAQKFKCSFIQTVFTNAYRNKE